MNKVLIAAAGTGGHIFPALAVAEQMRDNGWQVDWLGTQEGRLESRVIPAANFPLHSISMTGVRGHGLKRKLFMPFTLAKAVLQCRRLLKTLQPQVVATFGGYVCAPMGLAAKLLGIPLVVHEQNAIPGMTTRLLAPRANKVMLGLPVALPQWQQYPVVGNPLRKGLLEQAAGQTGNSSADGALNILVVGGSLGAQVLNEAVPEAVKALEGVELNVLHQCGAEREATTEKAYLGASVLKTLKVTEFIEDMGDAFKNADLVICRAGALTISELAVMGVASILVPLPHAVDDHQSANAKVLESRGAAVLLPQTEVVEGALKQQLKRLLHDRQQLWTMARFARQCAMPEATQRLVNECMEYRQSDD
ncbi:undecaprenyldiphospho-muramoylpentapeptide beta-N-acetylglucosaminyltransferase [Idiomarina loihiensis]|uniref:undecaprenyldiphospho-muramoylpentapeptide beta-N-acetylglucosaminyltransferase n=1 Tax=Idiomarina loihiensis TaxID=135577 RepID=UPI00129C6D97|nr:undecaprenyldiphospho-muramoylpentapeptide beta-N-acetylglucosaminyltransferase [Idiomarina loihiensis]MRJ45269.1 undecaprenyldiphospho-muramoylpentapeptide beta-N-acetylglucosaminyltransferase [Idiomarina loihiensis]UTW32236.1 undecaprenyldiphospho-muramoylpentapeptide beta-N-acetylglucosaminyltransferase [Idiomarina loihiensis]